MNLIKLSALVLLIAALAISACVSFGHFATAEDQAKWGTYPCMMRGPDYPDVCDDDFTDERAADICPCHPETILDVILPSNDTGARDAGAKD